MNSGAKKVGWTGISRRNSSPESILFCLAPFFGSEGWGFESLRARHRFQKLTSRKSNLLYSCLPLLGSNLVSGGCR